MKIIHAVLFFLFLFCFCNSTFANKKKILILHSYHQGFEWSDNITSGIKSIFEKSNVEVEFSIEYLDTKKKNDSVYLSNLAYFLKSKYNTTLFDIIITVDNNAFELITTYKIFPSNIPIVFCGINNSRHKMLQGIENVSGVIDKVNYKKNIELIFKLHPNTENIYIVIDNKTPTAVEQKKMLVEELHTFDYFNKLIFLEDLSFENMLSKVKELPDNSAILLLAFNKDKNDRYISFLELVNEVTEKSPVPVYGGWKIFLGKGIVGGLIVSGYKQGIKAGEIALKIISGTDVNSIPIILEAPSEFMFDFSKIKQFKIESTKLPENSEIINKFLNEKRVALLIGNSDYKFEGKLENTLNDVNDLALQLEELNFEVLKYENLETRGDIWNAIKSFDEKLNHADVALFYYSGHGFQSEGINYLVPTNANIVDDGDIEEYCHKIDKVIDFMKNKKNSNKKLNIVILDACRNKPQNLIATSKGISFKGGLAEIDAPSSYIIAFATSVNKTADASPGERNSLYTKVLLEEIKKPNILIETMFKNVRLKVDELSNGRQVPTENTKLFVDFMFNPIKN